MVFPPLYPDSVVLWIDCTPYSLESYPPGINLSKSLFSRVRIDSVAGNKCMMTLTTTLYEEDMWLGSVFYSKYANISKLAIISARLNSLP